ncbi:hypothetical protein ACL2XG_05390 [Sodalis sp. RH24]|uniref:hypothetical protein n=1 Tax=unclassified Sodalis (in: enterobacteria) TaxID=2636512 RepID=UPI0039B38129
MSLSDYVAVIGVIISMVGTFYAWQAYRVSRENSFPKRNAHLQTLVLKPFSDDLKKLNIFLSKRIDSKIYLNLRFESEEIEFYSGINPDTNVKVSSISIWLEELEPLDAGEKPTIWKCIALSINIEGTVDNHLYWNVGGYELRGYFAVSGHGSKQGHYGVTLKPLKVS